MEVYRVQNPAAYGFHLLGDLLKAAGIDDAARLELIANADSEKLGFFVGIENGKYTTLAIGILPSSALIKTPQVYNVFNRGSKATLKATILALVDFFKTSGYNKAWSINQSGATDWVYARLFQFAGEPTILGSILEFDLK